MPTCIQLRRSAASAWQAANPILANGEAGLETDTSRLKIGDGVTAWNALVYFDGARDRTPPQVVATNAPALTNDVIICEAGCTQLVLPPQTAASALHRLTVLNRSDAAVTVRGDFVPFVRGAAFTSDAAASLKFFELTPHGIANATSLTVSCWVASDATTTNVVWLSNYAGTTTPYFELGTSDNNTNINLIAYNATPAKIFDLKYPYTRGQLNHVFITIDMATSTQKCYINGVEVVALTPTTLTASAYLDFAQPTLYVAGHGYSTRQEMSGTLAQLWFAPGVYLAPATNLSRFYSAGPVDLGTNGELPTGARPAYFLNGTRTGFAQNLGANAGTFTINNSAKVAAGASLPREQIVGFPSGYAIAVGGSVTFLRRDVKPQASRWHVWL